MILTNFTNSVVYAKVSSMDYILIYIYLSTSVSFLDDQFVLIIINSFV